MKLGALLNPIIYRELATIGAIDSAMMREDNPGYVVLMRSAKSGKQASIGQMMTMLRREGIKPVTTAKAAGSILKLQTIVAEWMGTTPTLLAMRLVEAEIVSRYETAFEEVDGVYKKGIEKAWHRAQKHLAVLTAHIARPRRTDYFAHDEARVCMRCLFDRPGPLAPLERSDPHPYQYICSACVKEVLATFPPDVAESASRWEPRALESRIIEKALGRPSKLTAESIVLAKLSEIAPDMPPPPFSYKSAVDVTRRPTMNQPPAEATVPTPDALEERMYTDLLFDYESVRTNW